MSIGIFVTVYGLGNINDYDDHDYSCHEYMIGSSNQAIRGTTEFKNCS